jgi:protein AIR1/2
MVRYFQAPAEEQKQARFVCKRCGAEREHRTNECPVLIVRLLHIVHTHV